MRNNKFAGRDTLFFQHNRNGLFCLGLDRQWATKRNICLTRKSISNNLQISARYMVTFRRNAYFTVGCQGVQPFSGLRTIKAVPFRSAAKQGEETRFTVALQIEDHVIGVFPELSANHPGAFDRSHGALSSPAPGIQVDDFAQQRMILQQRGKVVFYQPVDGDTGLHSMQVSEDRQCMDDIAEGTDFDDKNLHRASSRRPAAADMTSSTVTRSMQRWSMGHWRNIQGEHSTWWRTICEFVPHGDVVV